MPVYYRSQILRPAPLVTIARTVIRDSNQKRLRSSYTLTLNGTIVNVGNNLIDSPGANTSSHEIGDDGQLGDIIAAQAYIRELFAVDGGRLEITAPNGSDPNAIDCYCTVDSINFDEGVWTNRCNYSIQLTTHSFEGETEKTELLNSGSENWSLSENPDGTYGINHTLSAEGATVYSSSGVYNGSATARQWCLDRSYALSDGVLTVESSGTLNFGFLLSNVSDFTNRAWNYSASESPGPSNNSWGLTENWLYIPSGNAVEQWTLSQQTNVDQARQTISVNGTITGYADRVSDTSARNASASGYWALNVRPNLYVRVQDTVPNGFVVNPQPLSQQLTYQKTEGTLSYSYSYLAASGYLIPNAVEENIDITDNEPTDIFASLQIPGRTNGPVVQDMNTVTLPTRTISISATLAPASPIVTSGSLLAQYLAKPDTNNLIGVLVPDSGNYYLTSGSEKWNPLTRQYSRNVTWTMKPEGVAVAGMPSSVRNK